MNLRPDFVSQYYKTSTFSFLSTNKAKLQQKVAERAKSSLPRSHQEDGDVDRDEFMSPVDSKKEGEPSFHTVDTGPKVILHVDMVRSLFSHHIDQCF
jgi:hypothetical protein